MGSVVPCVVVEEHGYEDQVAGLERTYPRLRQVLDSLYILPRNPELGTLLPGETSVRIWITTSVGAIPSFRILYAYDGDNSAIHLLAISPTRHGIDGGAG